MVTYDLERHPLTLEELLHLASEGAVRIVDRDGQEFIVAETDSFEEEVARLGDSQRFMRFLAGRQEPRVGRSLEDVQRDLEAQDDDG